MGHTVNEAVPPAVPREPRRTSEPGGGLSPEAVEARLRRFSEESHRFSREFALASGSVVIGEPARSATRNVELVKALFAKWSIEILFALFQLRELGFQELRDTMGAITPRVLSQRLRSLEDRGLVVRKVLAGRPTRVHYALTPDGLLLARLGEPVFLFLKYRHDGRATSALRSVRTGGVARRKKRRTAENTEPPADPVRPSSP